MNEVDINQLYAEARAGNMAAMRQYGRLVLEGKSEPAASAILSPKECVLLAAMGFDRKASWLLCDYFLHGKHGFELCIEGAANSYEKTDRRLLSDAQLSYEDDSIKMEAIALYQQWRNWAYRNWSEQRVFEQGLTNEEREQLEEYLDLIDDVKYDLKISQKTGFMSDSKGSVYSLTYEAAWSRLPGEVKIKLQAMSDLAREYVVHGINEQLRATRSLVEVVKIEEYVKNLLAVVQHSDKHVNAMNDNDNHAQGTLMSLTEDQRQALHCYREMIKEAKSDLADSMKTEYMSDSKSSVFALKHEDNFEGLPDEIKEELKKVSAVAWKSVTGMESVYRRAANTGFNVAEIERYVNRLLGLVD